MKTILEQSQAIRSAGAQLASVEKNGRHKGMSYRVLYEVHKGYWVEGEGEMRNEIAKSKFQTLDEAIDHAEMEIEGYLSEVEDSPRKRMASNRTAKQISDRIYRIMQRWEERANQEFASKFPRIYKEYQEAQQKGDVEALEAVESQLDPLRYTLFSAREAKANAEMYIEEYLESKGAKMSAPQNLPGGTGDKLTPADVDPLEFEMGMEVEKEHTPDEATRQEIVLDHLAEDPQYYSKLKEMESKGVDVAMYREMSATRLGLAVDFAEAQRYLLRAIEELQSTAARIKQPDDPTRAQKIGAQMWDASRPIESLTRKFS